MNDHRHALPAGYRLGEYCIERVLGSGGFGITYYAMDLNLDKPVAVKEYLPNEFALRMDATTVKPKSTADEENYRWGLERFLDEARALARFKHPHLNEVHRFFEDNNTAYIVLDYIKGETLSQCLKRESRLDKARLRRLLDELLSGLDEVHKAGYVHRDVKPGNIMFREDGSAVLLDFGAARQAISQRSRSITSILTPGYAPIEQYQQKSESVGPWSDLYSLGMVAYRCISGIGDGELPDAVSRLLLQKSAKDDDLPPALAVGKGSYDEALLRAIDWAIKVDDDRRPRSVSEMRNALSIGEVVDEQKSGLDDGLNEKVAVDSGVSKVGTKESRVRTFTRWVLFILFVAIMAGGVGWVLLETGVVTKTAEVAKRKAEEQRGTAAQAERERFAQITGRQPSPRFSDANGWTDLHTAAAFNLSRLAEYLVDRGADIHAKNNYGSTPLHLAAWKNAREAVEYLVSRGADINSANDGGITPLHWVAWRNAREIAEYLVDRGADVNARNNNGETPLWWAENRGSTETAKYLRSQGAR